MNQLPSSRDAFLKLFMERFEQRALRRARKARGVKCEDLLDAQVKRALTLYDEWTTGKRELPNDWRAAVRKAAKFAVVDEYKNLTWARRTAAVADHFEYSENAASTDDDAFGGSAFHRIARKMAIVATAAAIERAGRTCGRYGGLPPDDAIEDEKERELLENAEPLITVAMRSLPHEESSVLQAVWLDDRTRAQVAADRKVHPSTIGRIERRALLAMRYALERLISGDAYAPRRERHDEGGDEEDR